MNKEICTCTVNLAPPSSFSLSLDHHEPYLIYLAHRDDKLRLVRDLHFTLHYYQCIPQILSLLSTGVLTR